MLVPGTRLLCAPKGWVSVNSSHQLLWFILGTTKMRYFYLLSNWAKKFKAGTQTWRQGNTNMAILLKSFTLKVFLVARGVNLNSSFWGFMKYWLLIHILVVQKHYFKHQPLKMFLLTNILALGAENLAEKTIFVWQLKNTKWYITVWLYMISPRGEWRQENQCGLE